MLVNDGRSLGDVTDDAGVRGAFGGDSDLSEKVIESVGVRLSVIGSGGWVEGRKKLGE